MALIFGALTFLGYLIYAFQWGSFGSETDVILSLPWGQVMLFDLYVGFILFACFIWSIETNKVFAATTILLLFILGNIIALLYLLFRSKNLQNIFQKARHT